MLSRWVHRTRMRTTWELMGCKSWSIHATFHTCCNRWRYAIVCCCCLAATFKAWLQPWMVSSMLVGCYCSMQCVYGPSVSAPAHPKASRWSVLLRHLPLLLGLFFPLLFHFHPADTSTPPREAYALCHDRVLAVSIAHAQAQPSRSQTHTLGSSADIVIFSLSYSALQLGQRPGKFSLPAVSMS